MLTHNEKQFLGLATIIILLVPFIAVYLTDKIPEWKFKREMKKKYGEK